MDNIEQLQDNLSDCDGMYDNWQYEKKKSNGNKAAPKHYLKIGSDSYAFVDDTTDSVPSGYYRPIYDNHNGKFFIERQEIVKPKLYVLPTTIFNEMLNDIRTFWESEEVYNQFGEVYKLNFLLYSVPGNGKTCLIYSIEKYNGLIILINTIPDLVAYSNVIEQIRKVEPNRQILTVIEDFDGLVFNNKDAETLLLQLLDGNKSTSNIITIATTNYIDQLKPSFTSRPSRFRTYEYMSPNEEVRHFYYYNKLKDFGLDVEDEEMKAQINRITVASEGFSLDLCKELLILIFVHKYSEKDALLKMNEIKERQGKLTNTEEAPKKISFTKKVDLNEDKPIKVLNF